MASATTARHHSSHHHDQLHESKLEITPTSLELAPAKVALIRKQLLLLLHADQCKCEPNEKCNLEYCPTMKGVLEHLKTCSHQVGDEKPVPKCDFQYCFSSGLIIRHWQYCKSGRHCLICGPINSYLRKQQQLQTRYTELLKRKSPEPESDEDDSPKRSKSEPFHNELWSGTFHWHKYRKDNKENQSVKPIPMECSLFGGNNKTQLELTLLDQVVNNCGHMKLIPTFLLQKSPGLLNNKMVAVLVKFEPNQQVQELKELLANGEYCGYVHFSSKPSIGTEQEKSCLKSFILHYNLEVQEFIGSVPVDYQEFINSLRSLITGMANGAGSVNTNVKN